MPACYYQVQKSISSVWYFNEDLTVLIQKNKLPLSRLLVKLKGLSHQNDKLSYYI